MRYLAAAFIFINLLGCSSLPRSRNDAVVDKKNQAADYTASGNRYFNEGKLDDALTFFNLALDTNITVDNLPGMGKNYNDIGRVNLAAGRLEEAESMFDTAYSIAVEIDDKLLQMQTLGNKAELSMAKKESDAAIGFLQNALALFQDEKKPPAEISMIYHNFGAVYKAMERYDDALKSYDQAREINEKAKRTIDLSANFYMIASVYSKMEEYDTALDFAFKALELDKRIENSTGIAQDFIAVALISRKSGDLETAYKYFKKAFLVYRALGFLYDVKRTLNYLESVAEQLGYADEVEEYRNALEQLQEK